MNEIPEEILTDDDASSAKHNRVQRLVMLWYIGGVNEMIHVFFEWKYVHGNAFRDAFVCFGEYFSIIKILN